MDKLAHRILEIFMTDTEGRGGWTEDGRRELGRVVYENFLEGVTYDQAWKNLGDFWTKQGPMPSWFWTVTAATPMLFYCINMAGWYECGFPKVTLECQYASALSATRLTSEIAPSIISPWPYFFIEIEGESPLIFRDKLDNEIPVNHIFARWDEDRWSLTSLCGVWHAFTFSNALTTEALIDTSERKVIDQAESHLALRENQANIKQQAAFTGLDVESFDQILHHNARLAVAGMRLAAGACLAMTDPDNVRQTRTKLKPTLQPKNRRGLPLVRTFHVGRPITINCRDAVRDWIAGRSSHTLTVQSLIRGHWKNQAHGPGFSLRKALHIEPYWRGPEDAPINVRPHLLQDL